MRHAVHEDGNGDDEAGDRAGGRNVEEGPTGRNRGLDSDHGAERSHEKRDAGEHERERRRNAVVAAREVVPHLVGSEDQEHEARVDDAVRETRRREQLAPGTAEIEPALPGPASCHARRDERREQKTDLEGQARRRSFRHRLEVRHPEIQGANLLARRDSGEPFRHATLGKGKASPDGHYTNARAGRRPLGRTVLALPGGRGQCDGSGRTRRFEV